MMSVWGVADSIRKQGGSTMPIGVSV
eukprot:COSAG05_NODE_23329_length_259_cov_0.137500_2_plen_25_part_01